MKTLKEIIEGLKVGSKSKVIKESTLIEAIIEFLKYDSNFKENTDIINVINNWINEYSVTEARIIMLQSQLNYMLGNNVESIKKDYNTKHDNIKIHIENPIIIKTVYGRGAGKLKYKCDNYKLYYYNDVQPLNILHYTSSKYCHIYISKGEATIKVR